MIRCKGCRFCVGSCAAAPEPTTRSGWQTGAAETARTITAGARRDSYGPPALNHGRTATLWSAYLHARGYPRALSRDDVCFMNLLQKVARECHGPSPDNLTDIIGYVLNIEEMRADPDSR